MKKIIVLLIFFMMVAIGFISCDEVKEDEVKNTPTEEVNEVDIPEENTVNDIITVTNNAEFASILIINDHHNSAYDEFSKKYRGKVIKFDGHIRYVSQSTDYETLWDILLVNSDYIDEDTVSPGPLFQFKNVNSFDLGISDLDLPSFIKTGSNVSVLAKVGEYDYDSGIFRLSPAREPVSIEER